MVDHEKTLKIKYDDVGMKTKHTLPRFGESFGTLRFDEKSFFKPLLGFKPHYTPTNATHADSPRVNVGEKNINSGTLDEIHFKYEVNDGSVVKGIKQQKLYSFVIDKHLGFKVFCKPETIHYKKGNLF